MLRELPMTGLVKLHRGIAIVDGRRQWAESASWVNYSQGLESPATRSLPSFRPMSANRRSGRSEPEVRTFTRERPLNATEWLSDENGQMTALSPKPPFFCNAAKVCFFEAGHPRRRRDRLAIHAPQGLSTAGAKRIFFAQRTQTYMINGIQNRRCN